MKALNGSFRLIVSNLGLVKSARFGNESLVPRGPGRSPECPQNSFSRACARASFMASTQVAVQWDY